MGLQRHVRVFALPIPLLAALVCLYASTLAIGVVCADEPSRQFDGVWDTILSCANSNGALGYSFKFPSTVKDDVLHGEKGTKGEPGWLQLDGRILRDGSAKLYVDGLVGAAQFAVGQRPAGTPYGYHVDATFSNAAGRGTRVEGRPCTVAFSKIIDNR